MRKTRMVDRELGLRMGVEGIKGWGRRGKGW